MWLLSIGTRSADKSFHRSETKTIVIENQRWEPMTAMMSSWMGTNFSAWDAAAGIVIEPAKEFMRARAPPPAIAYPNEKPYRSHSVQSIQSHPDDNSSLRRELSATSHRSTDNESRGTARAMATASAKSFSKVATIYTKGIFVDVPLAVAEGMRAVPRLYGEDVKQHDNIKGIKSGSIVAAKSFAFGIADGLADLVVQPYKGAKQDGAWGAVKGVGKGALGMTTKVASGAMGLVAYPGQGLVKTISKAVHTSTRDAVARAKHGEGEWLLRRTDNVLHEVQVLEAFLSVKQDAAMGRKGFRPVDW